MSEQKASAEESVTVEGLLKALKFLDETGSEAAAKMEKYRHNFVELTGYQPGQQLNALDILKLVSTHWGAPKND